LWAFLVSLDSRGRRVATVVAAVIGFVILHALKQDEPEPEPAADVEPIDSITTSPGQTADATRAEAAPAIYRAPAKVIADIGLAIGTPAPEFVLPDLDGRPHSLESFRSSGKPVVLLFSSPFCESCQVLVPKLPGLAAQHADALGLVLITRGSVQQNLAKMKGPIALPVLLQQEFEVAEAYDCGSTPTAVLIGTDGTIQSLLAVGGPAIERLISSASREGASTTGAS
jgi:thiol-disulfide isomerase/thioredoxin